MGPNEGALNAVNTATIFSGVEDTKAAMMRQYATRILVNQLQRHSDSRVLLIATV
jgi:hypothetical protein